MSQQDTEEKIQMQVTSVNLPKPLLKLLTRAARRRADQYGGRASVSELVSCLLARHTVELEAMAGRAE